VAIAKYNRTSGGGGSASGAEVRGQGAAGRLLNGEQYGWEGGDSILNMRVCKYSDTGGYCHPIPILNR
jgi:hypothetical protein